MIRRIVSAAGCLLCLMALLAVPCFASGDLQHSAGTAPVSVCLTVAADDEASSEEEPLPPKYAPENARRNIAVVSGIVIVLVAGTAIAVRTHKGY